MGNTDNIRKDVNCVDQFIKLKDGRIAFDYFHRYKKGETIDILSLNSLKPDLTINILNSIKKYIQLKNGDIAIMSDDIRDVPYPFINQGGLIHGIIFISLKDKTYNIIQKLDCGHAIKKLLEIDDYIYYFTYFDISLIKKANNKYEIIKKISFECGELLDAFYLHNNEVIFQYLKSIAFFDVKEFKYLHKINLTKTKNKK